MMQQAKRDKAVDVYGFVSKMRNKRMKMVQTSVSWNLLSLTTGKNEKSTFLTCPDIIFIVKRQLG